eukprot:GHRR01014845.1.p1 GENE.GHRR01014845.1~~GHRR01014845.1.p1  ORF type:complete len:327 (+),score=70.66 GHRR01014845.1:591-1571(+)
MGDRHCIDAAHVCALLSIPELMLCCAMRMSTNSVGGWNVVHNLCTDWVAKVASHIHSSSRPMQHSTGCCCCTCYRQPHRRAWDRWLMMGAIGMTTGLVAYTLYLVIGVLAEFKYGVTRWLLLHTNLGVAWLFNTVVSLLLVAGSSTLVVGLAPAAVSSGVPDVMAYLNGVLLPKVFNIFTVCVKFASCALAVASGLPIGPEGPMIHIGAAVGAALSQGHSTTLGLTSNIFRRFRNPRDKRDFVTAGVAVGVATAFNAPIGGLLFAFEEVASFWKHSLGWQIFFACMCATLTLNLSRSAGKAIIHSGSFGWFNQVSLPERLAGNIWF